MFKKADFKLVLELFYMIFGGLKNKKVKNIIKSHVLVFWFYEQFNLV